MTDPDLAPSTKRALKLWVVLSRAARAVADHDKASVAEHGLTRHEFAVLEVLLHKGPLLLAEIQRRILVSSGGITYLVDRLAGQGLVERRPCPGDRRASRVHLTRRGRAFIERVFPEHARRMSSALQGLDGTEQERAIALLRTLGKAAAAAPLPGPTHPGPTGSDDDRGARTRGARTPIRKTQEEEP